MTTAAEIGWSRYDVYEGPFHLGSSKFSLPAVNPSLNDKILAVITATEGGRWDAINMYDRCILTVGLIQWCEGGQFSVSDMLGATVEANPNALRRFGNIMAVQGVEFKKNARGRWRWHFTRGPMLGEVDTTVEQKALFLLRSNGKRGTWDAPSVEYAKEWAAAFTDVYKSPDSIRAQRDYTVPRLRSFALPFAKRFLDMPEATDTPVGQAFMCAYLSFAANNPARADRSCQNAAKSWDTAKGPIWSPRWLVHVLEHLTFDSGVTIYPHRYNAIRPVLERLFGIDLPDRSDELGGLLSPSEIQDILVHVLHYDLGKSGPKGDGVDGAWGKKSTAALADFERRQGLEGDGLPDKKTNEALLKVRDAA